MPQLRIMTFNIRGAYFDDGANRWPARADLNIRTLLKYAPDLVGFQELSPKNREDYARHLSGYEILLGPAYNDHPPYQYPAIAWNPSHLRLVESGGFWLSQTPEVHSGSWDTNCIRSANWARLAWLDTGMTFLHLNTHLDHISYEARLEGARLILQRLAGLAPPGEPQVVTGDFNCLPTSEAYALFREAGFVDAYLAAGRQGPLMTFHAFLGKAVSSSLTGFDRIDYVLLHNWPATRVKDWLLVEDAEPPVYPSDHYPVLVDLAAEGILQPTSLSETSISTFLPLPAPLSPLPEIQRNAPIRGQEIEDLRLAVGWDRMPGQYDRILERSYAHFSAHAGGQMIAFLDVISDGIGDAFLVDLMVHPDFQRKGLGKALVAHVVQALRDEGIRMIQVIFDPGLETFYRQCGFEIVRAGMIDTWYKSEESDAGSSG